MANIQNTVLRNSPLKNKSCPAGKPALHVNRQRSKLLRALPIFMEHLPFVGDLFQATKVDLLQGKLDGVLQV